MEALRISQPLTPPRPQFRPSAPAPRSPGAASVSGGGEAQAAQTPRSLTEAQQAAEANGMNRDRLDQAIEQMNARLNEVTGSRIQFTVDDESGEVVVQVVDTQTDEVLRQIPPEEVIALRKRLAEMRGILIDRQG